MKILKIFLLIILSLFTILLSTLLILSISLERTLLDINHYEKITQEFDIFTNIHENLDTELLPQEEVEAEEIDEEAEAMTSIFKDVFEPQWLQSQALMVIGDVLQYTKGESEELTATIELGERKELIEEQIANVAMEQEGVPMQEAQEIAEQVAQDIDFPETISLNEMIPQEILRSLDTVILIRRYSILATIAVLIIFFILMLLLSSFSGGLKWFGASLLIPGLILFIVMFIFHSSLNIGLARTFVPIPIGFTFAIDVVKYTVRRMYLVPTVYASTGLVLIILGVITGKKKRGVKEEKKKKKEELTKQG